MKTKTTVINAAIQLIAAEAIATGTNLLEAFATVEDFRTYVSLRLVELLMSQFGLSAPQAHNFIFGEGSFQTLANDAWASAHNNG